MTVWVTSDLHFYHKNILNFCKDTRPYTDVDDMNDSIVTTWNYNVHPDDTVYILGDVSFANSVKTAAILARLNGTKILIKGNHDTKLVDKAEFNHFFVNIHDYLELNYEGFKIVMFHFPILEWANCHHGSILLHGHLHGAKSGLEKYKAFDVGLDATGNVVTKLDDLIEKSLTKELYVHHR